MLATAGELPAGPEWVYEFKWDGVRALALVQAGALRLFARSGAEITKAYPELGGLPAALAECGITDAILDGEVVLLDGGRPDFVALAERMHVREVGRARQRAVAQPVDYMIFDVLRANGGDIAGVPYVERRQLLDSIVPAVGGSPRWSVPPNFTDGPATLEAAKSLAMEGVVAKRLSSVYRAGLRSPDWVKIKHEPTGDYVVGGWRVGRRALGALLVGTLEPAGLIYRGRVGGGITAAMEKSLLSKLEGLRIPRSPFVDEVPREDTVGTTWVRPTMVVEVRYGNLTRDGRLRFPRFVRLRPDKSPEDTHDA